MLFSTFSFLFWFLPFTLILYFLPPAVGSLLARGRVRWALPWQNAVLLFCSLVFYAWGEPLYVFLMVGVILADTLLGVWIEKTGHKRAVLALSVLLHVGLLFYYKYAAFFTGLIGIGLSQPHMPLGISFYTFQALSYVADVYRGTVRAEKNPAVLGVYVALFPQLIAGPIVRYTDVDRALRDRTHSAGAAAAGVRRFAAGLAKKMLLANPTGALFAALMARGEALSTLGAWVALLSFSFQIYFDFSGYSDMAVGLGRIFGFRFPENFRYPYVARSITDFWRRWHITLSTFFREYVYIPLGGNRRGVARTVRNLLVVWLLTGLWHGAAWNFILWGLYYFLLLSLEKFVFRTRLPRFPRVLCHAAALLGILGGWLLFAFDGSTPSLALSALPAFVLRLLGGGGSLRADLFDCLRHTALLALCAIGSTPLPRRIYAWTVRKKGLGWLCVALPVGALLLSVVELSGAGFNPFLYFRF